MYKTAVIGDRASVLGFMSVGFTVAEADTAEKATLALKKLINEDHAVIFVTEDVAQLIGDEIAKYRSKPLPAIILIPGRGGSLGIGMSEIRSSVERAVGADILK